MITVISVLMCRCHGDDHGDNRQSGTGLGLTHSVTVIITVINVLMCKCHCDNHGDKCVDMQVSR